MPSVVTPIIDTAIGLIVVYIAFSLLTSWAGERINTIMQVRSKMLIAAIERLLSGGAGAPSQAAMAFLEDPIFTALKRDAKSDPQYLSAQQFSTILMGLLNPPTATLVAAPTAGDAGSASAGAAAGNAGAPAGNTGAPAAEGGTANAATSPAKPSGGTQTMSALLIASIRANAQALGIGSQVDALLARANGDYTRFVQAVEDWFDDHMDRVSGWYKIHSQQILLGIGLALAILWNADSVRVVRALSCNAALRSTAAAFGTNPQNSPAFVSSVIGTIPLGWSFSKNPPYVEQLTSCDAVQPQVVPMGWSFGRFIRDVWWIILKIVGLVTTAVAISLGAPFWFDVLSQLTRVRQAGKKPDGGDPSNAC
ncbi:MAG TPA: hypothetical protein VFB22_08400 [Candidatus Baltobacteraceae bacterium]|nr:hypothetical protein [Candidatus Baltobacteraceae bacterium]